MLDQGVMESEGNRSQEKNSIVRRAILPIIDRRFQFKVTLLVVGIVTLVHLLVGAYIFIHVSDFAYKLADFVPDLARDAEWFRGMLLRYMIITVISTFLLIIFLSLYFSSRISGPLFNMARVMAKVSEGDFSQRVNLRKNDELREFSENLNRLIEVLEDRESHLKKTLEELKKNLSSDKGNKKLEELIDQAIQGPFDDVNQNNDPEKS